ncbi:hypothetical protein [Limobrevibacterium gyesilva]|uniref:Uncharacterized protein n=1 Tax=Limobrevibacterium gyesilva TaxID=2991712 RepID=A0AA41YNZ6_9PROT|nr:hypothetical protein [Limobrevibacterium gyesilva]MCW3476235.1 hypothetical protein [Limobrevibacterium gyesilva]
MRLLGRLVVKSVGVFLFGVLGLFAMLLLAAGAILAWLIGCVSAVFLVIALTESAWWLHTRTPHAAMTALGYYGYAAGTFALIPVLFWLKDEMAGWPERRRHRAAAEKIRPL